jgi:hypothetical protein
LFPPAVCRCGKRGIAIHLVVFADYDMGGVGPLELDGVFMPLGIPDP